MKSLTQDYEIKAPVSEVWQALVNPKYIDGWGGGPAKMDDKVGTQFSLWSGDIFGKNTKVEPGKKLVQEWFGGEWDEPSIVSFTLEEKNGFTLLHLEQTHIPDDEFEGIREGWKDFYCGEIKKYLEKG